MKFKLCLTMLLMALTIVQTKGQLFTVTSYNGSQDTIHVLPLGEHSLLLITCGKDTLHINNVNYIQSAKLLNTSFLKVVCNVRAGVGMNWMQTLILSVSNHRLYSSLNVTSMFKEDFLDFSKPLKSSVKVTVRARYNAKLHLTGNNNRTYKLTANVHGQNKAINAPESNYNYTRIAQLRFDANEHIFYCGHEHIAQYFSLYDPKTGKDVKKHIQGTYPVVRLGLYTYYYIQHEWYEKPYSGTLSQYGYR